MATYTESQRPLEVVLQELPEYSREEITIASGEGVIAAGTVVGKVTGGNWRVYDDGNADGSGDPDGSEGAAGIVLYPVDATSAAQDVTALVRFAIVKEDALQWHGDVDPTAKTAAATALAALNPPILIRG